ncbi:MAG: acyl-[acyl-carrier-protein] thioesterase [Bacteroidota bacterium]|nr:thioesterase [Prevotella sp.]MDT3386207.1 acyl-[acyl-carrier-protein] thioesterase [Bacteroidota bacterium]
MPENQEALLPKIGSYNFMAEPFHCDFNDRLFMGHLGNAMLNAADFHSNERGYGMHYLNTIHRTWVLSRLAIEMTETPKAYEEYSIQTWVDAVMRFFTSRNFAVTSKDSNHVYGYGRSIWAMIDTESRQPVNLFDVRGGIIKSYLETEKRNPIDKLGRVKLSDNPPLVRSIDTFYNDVDLNGHVNSVKYIEHVLDLFDIDYYRTHALRRFEIAYVAESHAGDRLNFYVEEISLNEYGIKITKGTDEETEVVRSLAEFVEI